MPCHPSRLILSELFAAGGAEFLVFLNYPAAVGANPRDLLRWRWWSVILRLGTVLGLSVTVGLLSSGDWPVDQSKYSANQAKQSAQPDD